MHTHPHAKHICEKTSLIVDMSSLKKAKSKLSIPQENPFWKNKTPHTRRTRKNTKSRPEASLIPLNFFTIYPPNKQN